MPGTPYQKIVWLASYPKSGNTWLRVFLDAYLLGDYDINNLIASVSDDNAARYALGLEGEMELDILDLPVDIQQLMRGAAMLRLVMAFNANNFCPGLPLFVKTHNANLIPNGVTMLPTQLTQATIHIVRDPRDVCISFAKHMGCEIDKAIDYMEDKYRCLGSNKDFAHHVHDFLSSWRLHTNSFIASDAINCMTFRYEDMLRTPATTFAKMLRHCEIEPDIDRVEKALEMVSLDNLRKKEKEEGFREASPKSKDGFFGKGGKQWPEILTQRQIFRIEKMAGPMMKRFGYQLARNGGATKFAA